jgi:hypothetical protein
MIADAIDGQFRHLSGTQQRNGVPGRNARETAVIETFILSNPRPEERASCARLEG